MSRRESKNVHSNDKSGKKFPREMSEESSEVEWNECEKSSRNKNMKPCHRLAHRTTDKLLQLTELTAEQETWLSLFLAVFLDLPRQVFRFLTQQQSELDWFGLKHLRLLLAGFVIYVDCEPSTKDYSWHGWLHVMLACLCSASDTATDNIMLMKNVLTKFDWLIFEYCRF